MKQTCSLLVIIVEFAVIYCRLAFCLTAVADVICVQYEADFNTNSGLLDVALGGHWVTESTTELSEFMSSLPDWTVPIGWVAAYKSWVV